MAKLVQRHPGGCREGGRKSTEMSVQLEKKQIQGSKAPPTGLCSLFADQFPGL